MERLTSFLESWVSDLWVFFGRRNDRLPSLHQAILEERVLSQQELAGWLLILCLGSQLNEEDSREVNQNDFYDELAVARQIFPCERVHRG